MDINLNLKRCELCEGKEEPKTKTPAVAKQETFVVLCERLRIEAEKKPLNSAGISALEEAIKALSL